MVQGTDNTYYLDHDYYKKNALGIPFADYRAKITREQLSHAALVHLLNKGVELGGGHINVLMVVEPLRIRRLARLGCRAKITREQLSHNITIYGHSARDGSYFASLKNFNSLV